MSVIIEIGKLFISLAFVSLVTMLVGVLYGYNRKLGALLVILGLVSFSGLVGHALFATDWSTYEATFSWGIVIGSGIGGAIALPCWETGKDFGKGLKREN